MQKSTTFLCTNNEHMETEIKKIIFTKFLHRKQTNKKSINLTRCTTGLVDMDKLVLSLYVKTQGFE